MARQMWKLKLDRGLLSARSSCVLSEHLADLLKIQKIREEPLVEMIGIEPTTSNMPC